LPFKKKNRKEVKENSNLMAYGRFQCLVALERFQCLVAFERFQCLVPLERFQCLVAFEKFHYLVAFERFQCLVANGRFQCLVTNRRKKEKHIFHLFTLSLQQILLKFFFFIDLKVLFYHASRLLLMSFLPFP
jgi:hypothetical protein